MILKCKCRSCQHKGTIELDLKKFCESIDKIVCSKCRSKDIIVYNNDTLLYSYKSKKYCRECGSIILETSLNNLCYSCAEMNILAKIPSKSRDKTYAEIVEAIKELRHKRQGKQLRDKISHNNAHKDAPYIISPDFSDTDSQDKYYSPGYKKYGTGAIFHKKKGWKAYIDW